MAENVVGIDVVARLDGIRAEFAKLGGIGEKGAKELMAGLQRELKQGERAARDLSAATKASQRNLSSLGDVANSAGGKIQKMAGAADLAHPALGGVARAAADVFDVLEVTGGAVGVLTVLLAAGALAYGVYSAAMENSAKKLKSQREATEQTIKIERAMSDAILKNAHLRGEISDQAFAELSAASTADQLFAARKGALIEEMQKEQAALTALEASQASSNKATTEAQSRSDAVALAHMGAASAAGIAGVSTEATTVATAKHRDTIVALSTKLGGLITLENQYAKTLVENEQLESSAGQKKLAVLTEQESIQNEILDLQAKIDQGTENRRQQMREAYNDDLTEQLEADKKNQSERTEAAKKAAEERTEIEQQAAEDKERVNRETEDRIVDVIGSAANSMYSISNSIGDSNKKAALTAFDIAQALAATQVGMQTIVAASRAMADVPYPYNLAVAGAAVLAGTAQEMAIASTPRPSFNDTPGVQQTQMGAAVRFGAGDFFAAARSPNELRAQVERASPGASQRGPTVMLIGRQMYGRQLRDATEWRSPMVQAIAGTTPTGGRR